MNVSSSFASVKNLIVSTFQEWSKRDPIAHSSTIAYCTIFSLPGLLVIVINVAAYFYDKGEVTSNVHAQLESFMGSDVADAILSIVEKVDEQKKKSVISTILSIATLLLGATGVFTQVQKYLNEIWKVPEATDKKFLRLLKDRLFSFGLILIVGFLLLVSLLLSTVLAVVGSWALKYFSESINILFQILDNLVSLGVITLLFASIYKVLPDTKITWRNVWLGAFIASILFVLAKFALGFYFGQSKPESAYGAAGSIILIMLWVSYSSIILLFGAELTHVWATRNGTDSREKLK